MVDWADELKKKLENPEETAGMQDAVSKMSEDILRTQEKVEQLAQKRESLRKRLMQKISAIKSGMELGREFFQNKKYEDAKKEFLKVLELDPENEEAKEYIQKIDDEVQVVGESLERGAYEENKEIISDKLEEELISGTILASEKHDEDLLVGIGDVISTDKKSADAGTKEALIGVLKNISSSEEENLLSSGSASVEKEEEIEEREKSDLEKTEVSELQESIEEEEKSVLSGLNSDEEFKTVESDVDEISLEGKEAGDKSDEIASGSISVVNESEILKESEDKDLENAFELLNEEKGKDSESGKSILTELIEKPEEAGKNELESTRFETLNEEEGIASGTATVEKDLSDKDLKEALLSLHGEKGAEKQEESILSVFAKSGEREEDVEEKDETIDFEKEKITDENVVEEIESVGKNAEDEDLAEALKTLEGGEKEAETSSILSGLGMVESDKKDEVSSAKTEKETDEELNEEIVSETKEDSDLEKALEMLSEEKKVVEDKAQREEDSKGLLEMLGSEKEDVEAISGSASVEVEKDVDKKSEDEDLKEALGLLSEGKEEKEFEKGIFEALGKEESVEALSGSSVADVEEGEEKIESGLELPAVEKSVEKEESQEEISKDSAEETLSGSVPVTEGISAEEKEDKDLVDALKSLEEEKEKEVKEESVLKEEKIEEEAVEEKPLEEEIIEEETKVFQPESKDEDLKEALSLLEDNKQDIEKEEVIVSGSSETGILSGSSIEGDIEKYMEETGITKGSEESTEEKEESPPEVQTSEEISEEKTEEKKIEEKKEEVAEEGKEQEKKEDVLVEEITEKELTEGKSDLKKSSEGAKEKESEEPKEEAQPESQEEKKADLEISVEDEEKQVKKTSFITRVKQFLPYIIIVFSGMVMASVITMVIVVKSMKSTNKIDEILNKGAFEIKEGKFDQGVNTLYELVKFVENNNKLLDKYINAADIIYSAEFVSEEERLRKYKEARRIYDQIIKSFPANDYVLKKGVYFKAAECAKKLGLFEKSLEYYDEIISSFPKSTYVARAMFEKANTLVQMGYFNQARRLYAQVIKEYPDSEYAGRSYFKLAESYTLEAERIKKEFEYK